MPSLDAFARQKLHETAEKHLLRKLQDTTTEQGVNVTRNGKNLISFSGNDYFGLSQHREVKAAAINATERYGTGAGASRMVTGNHPLYQELETALANAKIKEAALVFGSGYLANLGTITSLAGKGDLIIADKLIHACMVDGALLSGAKLLRFPHNNIAQCKALLEEHRSQYRHCLILTETIFSMDGDSAPLEALLALCNQHDSWLLADDAHGLGIIPPLTSPQLIYTGTLSKALGSYGGYAASSNAVIDYLATTARSFIFTTGLPPATIAAAHKALELIKQQPELAQKALDNARYFTRLLQLPDAESTIVPVIIGNPELALQTSQLLNDAGFLVSAIRPPTVPPGTSRLRFTFSSLHIREDIEKVAKVLITYK